MSINNLNTYLNIRDAHLRVVSGNVYAQAMNIGGINVETAHGLQSVSNTGNATSLTLEFANVTTGFVTTANAQIGRDLVVTGNATISKELTVTSNAIVSSNLNVSDDLVVTNNILASNNLTVTGNLNVTTVMSDSNVVTEYTGPHDRPLRKYPEVAMTANDNSSTSGYVVNQTNTASHGNADAYAYRLFDSLTTGYQSAAVYSGGDSTSSAQTTTATDGSTHQGVAITLDLATKIRLSYAKITSHTYYGRTPVEGTFLGSNNNSTWDVIGTFSGLSTTAAGQTHTVHIADYATKSAYRYIRLVVTKIHTSAVQNGGTLLEFRELELYGYEEGSGSLDTTLKTVYNVPATTGTQLEVYYDAKDLTTMPSTVTDLSPNTNGGSVTGATLDTTDGIESFKFIASSSQYIEKVFSGYTQSAEYSASVWFKSDSYTSDSYIFQLGLGDHSNGSGIGMNIESEGPLRAYIYGYGSSSQVSTSVDSIVTGTWYHATATYYSSGKNELYVNGILVGEGKATQLGTINASAPLTLGTYYQSSTRLTPSFNGSIANFRLYSKALNADQVKELYDFQKDYFFGSKSQLTIYKGHLGVGVTEPSGQLELAGDERIQEYPPRGLVGDLLVFDPDGNAYDYNVEGHGVFKLLSSTRYHVLVAYPIGQPPAPPDDRRIYKLFDKSDSTLTHWSSFNSSAPYDAAGGSGAWVTTLDGGSTITAHIAEIQMPYKITLKRYTLTSSSQVPRALKTGMIVGSNDGIVYHMLHSVSDFGFTATYQTKEYTVDTTTPYRIFRLLLMNTNGHQTCNMNQWRLFGTPGPTTLDKGSLTLGRSLDVPRVSRYDVDTETPRPEKLLVDFDTTVNESPTDISGQGNHGVFYNGAYYSAVDKAFGFPNDVNTAGQIVKINTVSPISVNTDIDISFSVWVKVDTASTTGWRAIWEMGSRGANAHFGLYIPGSTAATNRGPNQFSFETWGQGYYPAGDIVEANRWYHVVGTYDKYTRTKALYVDGVYKNSGTITTGAYSSGPANPPLTIGAHLSGGEGWVGQVSNFKVYKDAILEPSEVKKLYNLGRTGRSMIISDTAVGIGKVPEAQLDIRGNLRVGGTIQVPLIISHRFITADTNVQNENYIPYNDVLYEKPLGIHSGTIFTCPVKGIYECHFASMTDNDATYTGNHEWYVNGTYTSPRRRGYAFNALGSVHKMASSHYYIECNSGDTIGVVSVGTQTWYGNSTTTHSHMSIRLITPT